MIDLDLGSCEPAPGSAADDARGLPWRDSLEAALAAAHGLMRSPTEHESNPLITSEPAGRGGPGGTGLCRTTCARGAGEGR